MKKKLICIKPQTGFTGSCPFMNETDDVMRLYCDECIFLSEIDKPTDRVGE